MTRTLLLTNDFPPVVSGIGRVFHELWRRLPGDRALVLTPRSRDSAEWDAVSDIRPIRFGFAARGRIATLANMKLMAIRTTWLVLFRGVREIHAGQVLSCGPIGLFFQAVAGIPCFLWVYGGETGPEYQSNPLIGAVVRRLLRSCGCIVTNSPAVSAEMRAFGIADDRIVEIVPGVDTKRFTPGSANGELAEKLCVVGIPVMLTVARIVARKGHDLVLRALAMLKDRDIRYVIAGDGPDRSRLEALAADLGLTGRVVFAGRVPENDLPDYYRLCDVYVMPSRHDPATTDSLEGFGISYIEANACGKPVIGGRSGGTGAAVEDGVTGYLVDPADPAALAEKIAFLLDHPAERESMGRRGRERVEREFSWDDRAVELAHHLTVDVAQSVAQPASPERS